ncbi:MAG: IS110 family transposase [Wenzhouxiangella sp.]
MGGLTEQADFVIGVDTHKDTHTGSVVNLLGAELAVTTVPADPAGYRQLLEFAKSRADGRRLWAIEGTGSYGRGLTTFLLEQDERVAEIDRPARPARRNGAKSDALDATRAAREALSRRHLTQPRRRGDREALRVLLRTQRSAVSSRSQAISQLKALLVTAPAKLRHRLAGLGADALFERCSRLRVLSTQEVEYRATVMALRATARRVLALGQEAEELKSTLDELVRRMAPRLIAEKGVGPITGAEILCAWSHRGRIRSEAAFATMAGVAPIPASSGKSTRYRLNRGGDRNLNCALYTIVLCRLGSDEETRRYAARRQAQGKTPREIQRCLKRILARRLFKLLEAMPSPT